MKVSYEVRCLCGEVVGEGTFRVGEGIPYAVTAPVCDCENWKREERIPGGLFVPGRTVTRSASNPTKKHVTLEIVEEA